MTRQPASIEDLADEVRKSAAVRVRAGGTKSQAVSPRVVTLDLRALRGIVDYSAAEGVLTALAGTPLAEIEAVLNAAGQYLPFDPPLVAAGATLGGTVATGLSGSGRYRYGGVRDFVIGARVVDGEGRVIRSGGRVVKNAAGFLLHHGMVGSLGRYGVLAEVTLKVFPRPEARATLRIEAASVDAALRLARSADVRRSDLDAVDVDRDGILWLRIAGCRSALSPRIERLRAAVGGDVVDGPDEARVWHDARELAWAGDGAAIVKVPLPLGSPLAPPTMAARYTCAGTCGWLATPDVEPLSTFISSAGLSGLVVRGPRAGDILGVAAHTLATDAFGQRLRRALDPRGRFSAAQHSDR
jgi:glycolate oxidase FAD binding subunit